jgi:hypothetical protein
MWPNVRKVLFWNDNVRIVGLSSLGSTIVGNFGDGPIYLSHVLLSYPKINAKYRQKASRVEFLELLQPGEFAKTDTRNEDYGKIQFFPSQEYRVEDRTTLIEKAVREKDCYRIVFFHNQDPFYMDMKEQEKDMLSINSEGYIAYYTQKNDKLKIQKIQTIAVVVKKDINSCTDNSLSN